MRKIIDMVLTILGLAALFEGWRRLQINEPKPTQDKQVTKTDYASGNYQRQLEERERRNRLNKRWGMTYIGAGFGFLLAGIYLLITLISPPRKSE